MGELKDLTERWANSPLTDERLLDVAHAWVDCDLCNYPDERWHREDVANFIALHELTPEGLADFVDELGCATGADLPILPQPTKSHDEHNEHPAELAAGNAERSA